jgi:thymidylate synthase
MLSPFIMLNDISRRYHMQKTTVFWGDNPSQLYMDALLTLLSKGKHYMPRGKSIKELRPVVFEYHNPLQRLTFLKGRIINPLFQLAESFWIANGRSDVQWLLDYNANMKTFSDDGVFFNAPYGERLRHWGKNDYRNQLINPIDQLRDCYEKIQADLDTRQAVGFIGNPHFDSSEYTLGGGKDIACNINIKFKVRDSKLDISVDNRSNDLHWGTFGANLAQFATIQELMASWLDLEVGTYYQISDSLHIYLDEYGAKETEKVIKAYGYDKFDLSQPISSPAVASYSFPNEPRFSCGIDEFEIVSQYFWEYIDPIIRAEATWSKGSEWIFTLHNIDNCTDDYLRMTFTGMFIKQAHNHKNHKAVIEGFRAMADSSWKISALRFLSKAYKDNPAYQDLYSHYDKEIIDYINREGE